LLGKNSQLGWELQRSLAPLGEVLALDSHTLDYCGDLSKPEQLAQIVLAYKPDFTVNAAV
jgi:dTDP-4-dehydrorhamnose reductase